MRRTPWLLLASALVALLAGFRQLPDMPSLEDLARSAQPSSTSPAVDKWEGPEPTRRQVLTALAVATVIPDRPTVDGYDRECGPGSGCVFGPDWSDDTSAAGGHDRCG